MSITQWREHIRLNGQLSQKQQRELVEGFPFKSAMPSSEDEKRVLSRVMFGMKELSPKERSNWWGSIKEKPSAIHVAIEKGLNFDGVDKRVVIDVMRFNLRHHPPLAAKIWDKVVPKELRFSVMEYVLDAWMDGDDKLFEKHWGPRLDDLSSQASDNNRLLLVSRVLGHAYEMVLNGFDVQPTLRELMTRTILRCAPVHLQLLSQYRSKANDDANLLAPLISEEAHYKLTHMTPNATAAKPGMRL